MKAQKLIDIVFEVGMTIKSSKQLQDMSNEDLAEWIRKQLSASDFNCIPVGSSWGVLQTELEA